MTNPPLWNVHPLYVPRNQIPATLNHNRRLPPLADQPLLELRRPSFKDACFTTSALSPHDLVKRNGGNWDSASTRTCLLDRYLSQNDQNPSSHDLAPSPCTPFTPFTPFSPFASADLRHALPHPGNSKNFWKYREAQKVREIDMVLCTVSSLS
jgi:hypothetical protein